jgi:hypothetical protein
MEKDLNGLRGWLILIGLGIVLTPIRMVGQVAPQYIDIFNSADEFGLLINSASEHYVPFLHSLIIGEMLVNLLVLSGWLYAAYLFFSKQKIFPKWYIGLQVSTLVLIALSSVFTSLVIEEVRAFDPETTKELGKQVVAMAIWIPYMLVSKRVKATFTRERRGTPSPMIEAQQ